MHDDAFLAEVQRRGELIADEAETLTRATLEELAQAITVEQPTPWLGSCPNHYARRYVTPVVETLKRSRSGSSSGAWPNGVGWMPPGSRWGWARCCPGCGRRPARSISPRPSNRCPTRSGR